MVYWVEAATHTIWQIHYNGEQKSIALNQSVENPVALSFNNSKLYFADNSHQNGSIKMASIDNKDQVNVLLTSHGNAINDIKIFSDKMQTGENSCRTINGDTFNGSSPNGGCAELCLFNGTHPVCACTHGEVSSDGKSCTSFDEFLIYSRVVSIESVHLTDNQNLNSPITKIQHPKLLRNAIGLSYDYDQQRIFYSDVHSSSINWVFFNGSDHRILVSKQVSVEGLSYDSMSRSLFWTSNGDASIRAIDTTKLNENFESNSNLVRQVIQLGTNDKPRGIAVEPCMGMVYWANWNTEAPSIQRAYITGYNLHSIITVDILMPNCITIDYENHKLYWADARLDKIERTDYDGSRRVVLAHTTPKHPFGITVYKQYLYLSDWILHAVVRVNKYSGGELTWLRKDIGRLMGIVAVYNTTTECSASRCLPMNGGCEDACFVVNDRIKCECTSGQLGLDGKRCIHGLPPCAAGQFRCRSQECIPIELTCDQISHCADGSDENEDYCNSRHCPTNYFKCRNARCIPMNQTCDGMFSYLSPWLLLLLFFYPF